MTHTNILMIFFENQAKINFYLIFYYMKQLNLLTLYNNKCYHQSIMFKKFFIFISVLLISVIPAFAGQYEDALRTGQPVLLYMYTKQCQYCKQFEPVFEKLVQNLKKEYRFVKIDAESPYGRLLMRDFRAGYVPYVILADASRQYITSVDPTCLLEYSCVHQNMKDFLNR